MSSLYRDLSGARSSAGPFGLVAGQGQVGDPHREPVALFQRQIAQKELAVAGFVEDRHLHGMHALRQDFFGHETALLVHGHRISGHPHPVSCRESRCRRPAPCRREAGCSGWRCGSRHSPPAVFRRRSLRQPTDRCGPPPTGAGESSRQRVPSCHTPAPGISICAQARRRTRTRAAIGPCRRRPSR